MTYLTITLQIAPQDRPAAVAIYHRYKQPFLDRIPGAKTKELLVRDEDIQVLHGMTSKQSAADYLQSDLFKADVVTALTPLLKGAPDIRIYEN